MRLPMLLVWDTLGFPYGHRAVVRYRRNYILCGMAAIFPRIGPIRFQWMHKDLVREGRKILLLRRRTRAPWYGCNLGFTQATAYWYRAAAALDRQVAAPVGQGEVKTCVSPSTRIRRSSGTYLPLHFAAAVVAPEGWGAEEHPTLQMHTGLAHPQPRHVRWRVPSHGSYRKAFVPHFQADARDRGGDRTRSTQGHLVLGRKSDSCKWDGKTSRRPKSPQPARRPIHPKLHAHGAGFANWDALPARFLTHV